MNVVIPAREINVLVQRVAGEVHLRSGKKHLIHTHVIMNGGFMFAADFLRAFQGLVAETSFTRIYRGYEPGRRPLDPILLGEVPNTLNPKHHHVILDVVYEEGKTADLYVKRTFRDEERFMITECYLVYKKVHVEPTPRMVIGKIVGREEFLTGYGMSPYRDFPDILTIASKEVL